MARRRIAQLVALPTYLQELAHEVEETTGYPVALVEEAGLGYDALTTFATPDRPCHSVEYVPDMRDHALHFVTVGLFKVRRFFSLPREDRYVPASDVRRHLPGDEHRELLERIPGGTGIDPDVLSRYLFSGTVRQLISVPGDMRVEQEIADQIPEHREDQRSYLVRQIADLEEHFAPHIEAFAPPRVYRASTAMNVVLAEVASDIAGVDFPSYVRASPHRDLGHALRARLDAEEEPGYRGDRRVTDAWANELRMDGWYEWVAFEEIERD